MLDWDPPSSSADDRWWIVPLVVLFINAPAMLALLSLMVIRAC